MFLKGVIQFWHQTCIVPHSNSDYEDRNFTGIKNRLDFLGFGLLGPVAV